MRKALVVGINYYETGDWLFGCVDDAHAVKAVLERHGDGTKNFDVLMLTGTGPTDSVSRSDLRDGIQSLFDDDSEIALLYFAGHGCVDATGGFLMTSDSKKPHEGVSVGDVLQFANASPARNKIIIFDCCHSGIAGTLGSLGTASLLNDGVTILTASTAEQYATEENDRGLFTVLLVDALSGVAANLLGEISPGGIYSYVDQSLGAWEQRPVFKTNVKNFVSIRTVPPLIALDDLRRITDFFPHDGAEFQLNPSFEPRDEGRTADMLPADPDNNAKFRILQKYNRVNLLVPVGAAHMWNAAMESKTCKLTVLGEHYRRLVARGRI